MAMLEIRICWSRGMVRPSASVTEPVVAKLTRSLPVIPFVQNTTK
jgi:hypothetical protein